MRGLVILVSASILCAQTAPEGADLQTAIKDLQAAVRSNPADAEAHARLGIAYRRLKMPVQAAESLERSVKLKPDPRVSVLLAFSYMEAGRHRDAIPLLAASFELEQKDAVKSAVGQRLVECYLATGDQEQALPVLQKLRQLAPDDPAILYLSSKVYMSLWNEAFQRLMIKAPGSYQVHLIQAEALDAQERFAEAAQQYRQILKIAPQVSGIHFRLGRALMRTGADAEALQELRKELEIDPGNVAALTDIAGIQLKSSQIHEASQTLSQALQLQPGYVPAKIALAKVLIAEKQWAKALEHLEVAAKATPMDEAVHYNLMLAYRGLGRAAEAKQAADTLQRLKEQRQRTAPR